MMHVLHSVVFGYVAKFLQCHPESMWSLLEWRRGEKGEFTGGVGECYRARAKA